MKRLSTLFALLLALCATAMAQLRYHEASLFKVIGQPVPDEPRVYTRMPDSLKGKVRDALWNLGQNTAGMAVRFRSDARQIGVRWKNHSVFNMNHMTATGIRGLDLYCLQDKGQWVFVNSAKPQGRLVNKSKIIENLDGKEHEYMLYLPLYEGIDSLEIGVEEGATIDKPRVALPAENKPVVWYGTSITQGGCASRPGMAATNIVERRLNRVVVNLGFSGNGKLDPEVAEIMARHDAGLYRAVLLHPAQGAPRHANTPCGEPDIPTDTIRLGDSEDHQREERHACQVLQEVSRRGRQKRVFRLVGRHDWHRQRGHRGRHTLHRPRLRALRRLHDSNTQAALEEMSHASR